MSQVTCVQLAATLLRGAAMFYRNVGAQNEPIRLQLADYAEVAEQLASLLEDNPAGALDLGASNGSYVYLAARHLREGAAFFRNVGAQNAPVKEQLDGNADVYEKVAGLLESGSSAAIDWEQIAPPRPS